LVDVSDQYIWRFLREQKIDLAARKSWCQTDDPDFVAKAAEIVGLYLDPPQMPSSWRSTKSRTSRRWSAPRAISSCPTVERAQRSQSRLQAQRHLDLVCRARRASPAKSRPAITSVAGASSSPTS
jgi:hypothetical protein